MRTAWLVVALLMALASAASGQRLYWGVIGGTGLTSDFPRYDVSGAADAYGNPAYHFEHLPDSRSLILGGLLEVQLTSGFAIEAAILHRPLADHHHRYEFSARRPQRDHHKQRSEERRVGKEGR